VKNVSTGLVITQDLLCGDAEDEAADKGINFIPVLNNSEEGSSLVVTKVSAEVDRTGGDSSGSCVAIVSLGLKVPLTQRKKRLGHNISLERNILLIE
jgi:hypothetical protein